MELHKSANKKEYTYFIQIDFYIKLYIELLLIHLRIKDIRNRGTIY